MTRYDNSGFVVGLILAGVLSGCAKPSAPLAEEPPSPELATIVERGDNIYQIELPDGTRCVVLINFGYQAAVGGIDCDFPSVQLMPREIP